MHTIQQARLLYPSTYIIAVASSQHHSRLQTLGADACFDYKSSTIENEVKALGKNVTRAIDCHSEGQSTVSCAKLMYDAAGKGLAGKIVRTLPPSMISGTVPQGVRADDWILSYTALGKVCSCFRSPSPISRPPQSFHPHHCSIQSAQITADTVPSHSGSSSNTTRPHPPTMPSRPRI